MIIHVKTVDFVQEKEMSYVSLFSTLLLSLCYVILPSDFYRRGPRGEKFDHSTLQQVCINKMCRGGATNATTT